MKITPSTTEIEKLAKDYDIIPVCSEIFADIVTPISLLRKIAERSQRYFLLESIEGGEKWARYSFLGFDPIVHITCKNHVVKLNENGTETVLDEEPYDALRNLMKRYKAPKLENLPPFTGGLVGYFSYAMIGYAEPTLKLQESDCDDYSFMLFDKIIAYDHLKQKITLVANMKTDKVMENYGAAIYAIGELKNLVTDSAPLKPLNVTSKPHFTCNFSKQEYSEAVEKTKEYIYAGDIFQAVISRRFETEYHDSLLNAYRVLRTTNPSPYMVFFKYDDREIMSTSPETLVKLQNGTVTTFPIAGSRPRGATPEQDKALETELLADEKELSEHNMLVDLGRNDIGKIAQIGSVKVTDYKIVQRFSQIMHICSEVTGKLKNDLDAFDAVQSILPAGTLSGAPKIRACEIIEELEKGPRGIYGGTLGYIDFTGNLDTCIAIRMAVKKGNKVTVQAGGGIVADSVPDNEYFESANKAKAIIDAILAAGEVD